VESLKPDPDATRRFHEELEKEDPEFVKELDRLIPPDDYDQGDDETFAKEQIKALGAAEAAHRYKECRPKVWVVTVSDEDSPTGAGVKVYGNVDAALDAVAYLLEDRGYSRDTAPEILEELSLQDYWHDEQTGWVFSLTEQSVN
jgi:hypothetical protein